jgi:drug/metabolite transporter (DMT)-like permease
MRTEPTATPTRSAAIPQRISFVASLIALSSGIVWSFGAVTARLADGSDAFQYLIWRSVAIIAVIETIALARRRPAGVPRALAAGWVMRLACASLLLASIAFIFAVKNTTPANAAFLGSLAPLVAALLAKVVLSEPLTPVTIAAVVVAFVGLCITAAGELDGGRLAGNVAALLASVGFAGYAVCLRTDPHRDWSPVLPGYALVMIGVCAAITLVNGEPLVPPASDIAYAVFHGAVFIVVGTMLFNLASRQIPAVSMAVFAQSEMLFVPIWAFLVLGEQPRPTALIGGTIIFGAVIGKAILDARRRPG